MAISKFQDPEIVNALSALDEIALPHPSGTLLTAFIEEALDPLRAAIYVSPRITTLEDAQSLLSDWIYIIQCITDNSTPPETPDAATRSAIARRDGDRCCITGKRGSLFDPLCVAPILPLPIGWTTARASVSDVLGAFFGPPYRDWWLWYMENPQFTTLYENHWLVRESAARDFAEGHLRLARRQPSMIEYQVVYVIEGTHPPLKLNGIFPLLGDHSRTGIEKVDPRFVGTHCRLATSIRFVDIAKRIAPEILDQSGVQWKPPPAARRKGYFLPLLSSALSFVLPLSLLGGLLLATWRVVPGTVRLNTYRLLLRAGRAIYGRPPLDNSTVQKLPFGLYLKYHGAVAGRRNEYAALRLVRQYTSIPVPHALDVVLTGPEETTDELSSSSPDAWLLVSRLPGVPLLHCQDALSDKDRRRIISQLQDYVTQLRCIPNRVNKEYTICNSRGGPVLDHRIQGATPLGPFADEAAFSDLLRFSDEPSRHGHDIVFTHADLNPRNILVDEVTNSDGSTSYDVTGIIDWETAGYLPEYWEYTKALFEKFSYSERYQKLVHDVFSKFGDYSRELDVEVRSWESGDAV
ncbi:hypothetical protein F5Y18DRAFT_95711 [Xylariaceae sp. FL1019]|nr:hypothetical protein F5Y18DRAFT_95711 [Xylariaceae sp. FL1019]